MAEVVWYYAKNDRQLGPVPPSELRRLATTGGLMPTDLIWREGMDGWAPASKVKGLFADQGAPGLADNNAAPSGLQNAEASEPGANFETPPNKTPPVSTERFSDQSFTATADTPPLTTASPTTDGSDLIRTSQLILWAVCVAIVLFGGILFARALLRAQSADEEIAAGAIYSTFFIGAYVVARAGERVAALVQAHFNRSGKR